MFNLLNHIEPEIAVVHKNNSSLYFNEQSARLFRVVDESSRRSIRYEVEAERRSDAREYKFTYSFDDLVSLW